MKKKSRFNNREFVLASITRCFRKLA